MSEEQVGERRRRREAERAAQAAEGSEGERPLTRRELRAREAALQTGELKIDDTGAMQVIKEPEPRPEVDLDGPATGAIGLTRRQLRELRERQAAAQKSTESAAKPSEPAANPDSGAAAASPGSAPPTPTAEPTPARGLGAPPTPPVRRPVVRPPASAGGVRSLTEDGAALAPVSPRVTEAPDTSSPTGWTAGATASVDVTGSLPQIDVPPSRPTVARDADPIIVRGPGPLPTTRRTQRVVDATIQAEEAEASPPSLDALIAGESEEPEPFEGTPSWAELPPPTPASPMPAITPAAPEQGGGTEVMPAAVADATGERAAVVDEGSVDDDDEDEDEDEEDEHRTPGWLTALMVLVLVVIAIVLGLLVWNLVQGEGTAAGLIWQGGTVTQGTRQ